MKREFINVATGMINLKSNHGWTDRVSNDHTTKGEKVNSIDLSQLPTEVLQKIIESQQGEH